MNSRQQLFNQSLISIKRLDLFVANQCVVSFYENDLLYLILDSSLNVLRYVRKLEDGEVINLYFWFERIEFVKEFKG